MNAASRKLLKRGRSSAMPKNIEPMLATLVEEIPGDEQNWTYEIKWDGYRAIAYLNNGGVDIRSRNNKSFNEKFYPVHDTLKKWNINAVVDGEIVVVNDEGMPDFGDLQLWRSEADGQLVFYLFDVLWLEGFNVMSLPLEQRHQLLQAIIPSDDEVIKISEQFNTPGKDFFSLAEQLKLEGIFAKDQTAFIPRVTGQKTG
jgi:bifunctional non-homologous end joining protein LigD